MTAGIVDTPGRAGSCQLCCSREPIDHIRDCGKDGMHARPMTTSRCRSPGLSEHFPFVIEGNTENLRPAHVDPDGHRDGTTTVHALDSTLAFRSCNAVCMIRPWALRLMKPGRGTLSSTWSA